MFSGYLLAVSAPRIARLTFLLVLALVQSVTLHTTLGDLKLELHCDLV